MKLLSQFAHLVLLPILAGKTGVRSDFDVDGVEDDLCGEQEVLPAMFFEPLCGTIPRLV